MDLQLIIGLLLTILPITELRGGLPIIVDYCLKNNLPITPFFLLVIFLNILVIFLIYLFLEFLHQYFIKFKPYRALFYKSVKRVRQKQKKFEKDFKRAGYLALCLFVAIPLPLTGAWTGTFLAWLLGLNRKKSIVAIGAGVLIAGIIILISSFGILSVLRK